METRVSIQKVNNHNFLIDFDVIFLIKNLFIVLLIKFFIFCTPGKSIMNDKFEMLILDHFSSVFTVHTLF